MHVPYRLIDVNFLLRICLPFQDQFETNALGLAPNMLKISTIHTV